MDTLSPTLDARARKTLSHLLQALAGVGQKRVADALGVSVSTVSRMQSGGEFEQIARLLTVLGFKPVPVDAKCVTAARAAEIEAEVATLRKLALRGLESMSSPGFMNTAGGDDDTGFFPS